MNAYISESSKRTLYSDMTLRRLLAQSDKMSNILAPDPGAAVDHPQGTGNPGREI